MKSFTAEVPDWGELAPCRVTQRPQLKGNSCVTLSCGDNAVQITLHDFGARIHIGAPHAADYGILIQEPSAEDVRLDNEDEFTIIEAGVHRLVLTHDPFSFVLYKNGSPVLQSGRDGHFVRRHRIPPFCRLESGWLVNIDLASSGRVFGLGEKWSRLDRRGEIVRSYNRDALGVNAEWSYKNTPFAWSPAGWGVFVLTPAPVTHAVGFAPWSQRSYGLLVEDATADIFLFTGDSGRELIRQYTGLTGRAPVPPLWSLGAIISKAYYRTPGELLETARTVRAHDMPCDTITLDGRAWQDTETRFAFEWDPARFEDPAQLIADLHALDFKVCVWEYPLVSVKNPLFDEMAAKGWLLCDDEGNGEACRYEFDREPFGAVLTPLPPSGLVDFTHPEACAYWRDRHKELFEIGVDMIKADFGEQVEPAMRAYDGSTGTQLHNVYALLYNRCVYEAAERYAPNGAFLFSRAGWAGSQRYPAQWGGDPQADWEGLAASLRGGLSWGLSGAPFYATDVGGFYGDERDTQLYVRWTQAAVFSAHMRLHGIGAREPWSYGPEAQDAAMAALELRYRLIPYLFRAMQEAAASGLPVQRAMVLGCPDDPAAWGFDDQFFFGADMLVAPCLRPDGLARVYLPHGDWRRFPSGEPIEGGRVHDLVLELDEMAVFVRAGVAIPLGPAVQHTGMLSSAPVVEEIWRAP